MLYITTKFKRFDKILQWLWNVSQSICHSSDESFTNSLKGTIRSSLTQVSYYVLLNTLPSYNLLTSTKKQHPTQQKATQNTQRTRTNIKCKTSPAQSNLGKAMPQTPYYLQWDTPNSPAKLPLPLQRSTSASNRPIPWLTPLTIPIGIWIQPVILPQYTFRTDWPTDRQTG